MTTHQLDNDPLECRAMLAESLADPALACFAKGILPDDASRHAAYIVAVSIGRCRLFGIGTDREMDGALPLAVAHAAVQWMFLGVCHGLRAGANGLPKRLNEAIAVEAEDLCLDLLAGRLNAWAAQVALEEAYRAEDDGAELDAKKLAGALDSLAGELLLVDDALRAVAIELTLAASGYLLENWRGLLAPEYVEIAPCWLTGELAQLAAQLAEQESEPFLDKDAWNIARRAIRAKRVGAAIAANAEAVESSEEMEMAQPAGEDSPDDGLAPNNMDGDLTDAGYEEEEMAIAADDGGGLDGPTPAEQSIQKARSPRTPMTVAAQPDMQITLARFQYRLFLIRPT